MDRVSTEGDWAVVAAAAAAAPDGGGGGDDEDKDALVVREDACQEGAR